MYLPAQKQELTAKSWAAHSGKTPAAPVWLLQVPAGKQAALIAAEASLEEMGTSPPTPHKWNIYKWAAPLWG